MAVELSLDRKAIEITWDVHAVKGNKAHIRCVNPEGGDVSEKMTLNDGRAVLTFPKDYSGDTEITVRGNGNSYDWGMISV